MNAPTVTVKGCKGFIFEGALPETFCFVPEECVSVDDAGQHVDEVQYIRTGWDLRNMRQSDADGNHLFPKTPCRIAKLEGASVRRFLARIRADDRPWQGAGQIAQAGNPAN